MKKIILFAFLLGNVALYGQSTVATINKGYKLNAGQYLDTRMGTILAGKSVPYSGVSAANAAIFPSFRCVGMTVLIDTLGSMKEYWYLAGTANGNLVPKETGGGSSNTFLNTGNVKFTTAGLNISANVTRFDSAQLQISPTGITAIGNSIMAGQNSTVADSAYIKIYGTAKNLAINNQAVGGSGIHRAVQEHFEAIPFNNSTMTVSMAALNDIRRSHDGKTYLKIINGYKAMFANHVLKSFVEPGTLPASITEYGAGWDNTFLSGSIGGKGTTFGAYTGNLNDSIKYTFSDTTVCVFMTVADGITEFATTSFEIWVDDILQGMYSLNGQTDGVSDGVYNNRRTQTAFWVTGLSNASHKIVLKNKNANYMYVNAFGHFLPTSSTVPFVIMNDCKLNAAGYALSPDQANDTYINLLNTRLDSLRATLPQWYQTYSVPTNSYYNVVGGIDADNIHPNDVGHRQIAQALLATVTSFGETPPNGTIGLSAFTGKFVGAANGQLKNFAFEENTLGFSGATVANAVPFMGWDYLNRGTSVSPNMTFDSTTTQLTVGDARIGNFDVADQFKVIDMGKNINGYPSHRYYYAAAGTDNKRWDSYIDDTSFIHRMISDASVPTTWMTAVRSGATPIRVEFTGNIKLPTYASASNGDSIAVFATDGTLRKRVNPSGGGGWSLTGNSGTTAGTNFIGTTDNVDLVFKRNGLLSGRIGSENTYFGNGSGSSRTSGVSNAFFGQGAGYFNTTGSSNTFIGDQSGASNTTGSNNIYIGNQSGVFSTTLSNRIIINSITHATVATDTVESLIYGIQSATVSDQKLRVNGKFQINDATQGSGKVLTSDANGVGSWQTPSGGGSGGMAYLTQNTAPTGSDTTKLWVNNSISNAGIWPIQEYYRTAWRTIRWYDSAANYTSRLKPLVVLATGQSNMDIRADARSPAPDSRVLYWNGTNWVVWNLGAFNNLGFQFAKNVAQVQDRVVRVIHSSLSGSSITNWNSPSGARFLDIRSKITASKTTMLDVILWRQGEAENADALLTYKAKFDTVINRFRNETWFNKINPVIVGGLIPTSYTGGSQKYFETINENEEQNLLYNSNAGLYSADVTHFEGGAIDSSGSRMAAVYLYGKTKASPTLLVAPDATATWTKNSGLQVQGSGNVAIGNTVLNHASASGQNIGIGTFVSTMTGIANSVAIGHNANSGSANTSESISIGTSAGGLWPDAGNIAIGHNSGGTTSTKTVAVGWNAAQGNAGASAVHLGGEAGQTAAGNYQVNIGYRAGKQGSATGTGNIAIGWQTGFANSFNNVIQIGASVVADKANQVIIGASGTTEFRSANYRLNVGQTLPTAQGFNLALNTTTGQIELQNPTPYTAKTATYTILNTDNTVDATSGTFTATLPTAVGVSGKIYTIKNSGAGVITVATTSSQTIDGSTTYSLATQYKYVTVQSNGANWIVIANN